MNFEEKTKKENLIFDGVVLHVYCDDIIQPDGREAKREYAKHLGAVCVVPLTAENEVICVKQYRYAHAQTMIEIPAGKLDTKDEVPEEAARRELREETGMTCEKLTPIGKMYGSPAILDEVVHMYLAEGLIPGECDPDEDEILETFTIPLDEMVKMVMDGEICDAKTQIAILKANNIIKSRNNDNI